MKYTRRRLTRAGNLLPDVFEEPISAFAFGVIAPQLLILSFEARAI